MPEVKYTPGHCDTSTARKAYPRTYFLRDEKTQAYPRTCGVSRTESARFDFIAKVVYGYGKR